MRRAGQSLRVVVVGAGKVGASLARALRHSGVHAALRPARAGRPARTLRADLVILAVRDGRLRDVARAIAPAIGASTAVVHCAGALGPEALEPLRARGIPVGQMHPMISFASRDVAPALARGHVLVAGDRDARRLARRVARRLGMTPRTIPRIDRVLYHAAAALAANGSVALAGGSARLLARAGVRPDAAARMLGPLLRSVGENVERLGLPAALTGPIRRGDARTVAAHRRTVARNAPDLLPLYLALGRAQLEMARALGETRGDGLRKVAAALRAGRTDAARARSEEQS